MGKKLKKNIFWKVNFILGLSLILVLELFLTAVQAEKNQIIKIFPTSFSANPTVEQAGWQNPQAAFIQDLDESADFEKFNSENSAFLIETELLTENTTSTQVIEKTLELSGFNLTDENEEEQITNVTLRISLSAQGDIDDKLAIDYFSDQSWQNLISFNLINEISNATNGGYFSYDLPNFNDWQKIENLKIKFTYQTNKPNQKTKIYLDSLWLEVETVETEKTVEEEKPLILPQKTENLFRKYFRSDEKPEFLIPKVKFNQIVLVDPDNKEIVPDLSLIETKENYKIQIEQKQGFRPGKYILKVKTNDATIEQEFLWGVLAINTNKSIYNNFGETVYLQMAVLRDDGHTICDANLKLEIKNPKSEIEILTTENGTIQYSGKCKPNNVTDVPDYFAYYQVGEPGIYEMKLTNLDNGYEIKNFFEVRDSVPFEVERIGPTRIYPPADYEMSLKIKVNQDFSGEVVEIVPEGFEVKTQNANLKTTTQNSKLITWQVDWKAGESYELKYQFDAPDISPYLYLLGPLKIGDFQEARQWQIASDDYPETGDFFIKTGHYIGRTTPLKIYLGFRPEMVIVKSSTNAIQAVFKTTAMPAPNVAYLSTATADSTGGMILFESDGFVVSSTLSSANVIFTYIAFAGSDCSSNGVFCIGSYQGTGSAKSIVTGFQPDIVWVKSATNAVAATFRTSAMPNNVGQYFIATNQDTSGALFQTLNSNGFTVGATNSSSGVTYYYAAFKNITGKVNVGTYTGNATDNRNITGVGFVPNWVIVKNANASTAVSAVYNVTECYGDSSYYFTATANLVNAIQALQTDGFQVGTDSTVNGSGNTIYWIAFGDQEADPAASGTFKMAKGSYTGTGELKVISGLDFSPDLVIIKGNTAQAGVFRTKMMAGDSTAYLDSATANFTGGIISLNQDGFTIGTNATVNSSGVTYYWEAFGNAWKPETRSGAADFFIGAYYGNGIDNRNITNLPFQPDLVVVKRSGGTAGAFRTSLHSGDSSSYFTATADAADIIQAFNSDGFQIGTAANVNTAGSVYWYFGFKSGTNLVLNSYTGNGSSQNITTVGFQPDFLWVKAATAQYGVQRNSAVSGDLALPFINTAGISNAITGLLSNGFSVGSAAQTNSSGVTYRYVAWRVPISSVIISISISDGTVDYGIMSLNSWKSTLELSDTQTATNTGNVNENFKIKGKNSDNWTLSSSQGDEQYVHQFCNDTDKDCSSPPTNYTPLTTSYQDLDTNIPPSGTVDFQLRLGTPTATTHYTEQDVDVTLLASAS
jgi:hypothetical protein